MSTKLKVGALVVVLLGIDALFLLQQQQIKRLTDENADLRTQLNQMASLRDSNGHLAEQLKAAVETSQVDRSELVRLRGEGVRLRQLEQENTELKAQHQPRGGTASAVEYRNEQYGFGMTFPSGWSGYSVVAGTWQGQTQDNQGETTETYTGPEIILRVNHRLTGWLTRIKRRGFSGSEGATDRVRFVSAHRLGGVASPVCRGLEFGPRKSSWPPCRRCL